MSTARVKKEKEKLIKVNMKKTKVLNTEA